MALYSATAFSSRPCSAGFPAGARKFCSVKVRLKLDEIARVLVHFDHVASGDILNAHQKILLFTLSSPRSPCSEKP
jgi:hypothetical protein